MSILDSIDSPEDLRRLPTPLLDQLAEEIRGRIIDTVSCNGGHLASNLGVVELTIALHRVFRTPEDTILWDVGHQCYTHKLLTGRRDRFSSIRRPGGLSGFPKKSESVHDSFDTGHASTAISTALGLLEGRIYQGLGGKVVAVVGDGALNGGMAFEGMNHAGQLGMPLIVVLNDNKMSISPVVGSLSRYLSRLSATARYQRFRDRVDTFVRGLPVVGSRLFALMMRGKNAVKALFYKENLFGELGFEYIGPIDGHDIQALAAVFADVRELSRPAVVHVLTHKGRGHSDAEIDPASYHGVAPPASGGSATGASGVDSVAGPPGAAARRAAPLAQRATYTDAFSAALLGLADRDGRIVAVTAAMSKGTGLEPFRNRHPARFHDVGIAEQHAVTFAAGMAASGLRPVVSIYATFMQRAVDQVFHDVALQRLPVVFAVDRSGLVPDDGETHQGIYDLAMFRSMPGLSVLAPSSGIDLRLCLEWAFSAPGPVMVRYPKAALPRERPGFAEPLVPGRGAYLRRIRGAKILVATSGALVPEALEAAETAWEEGIAVDVYSLRFLAPIDESHLLSLLAPYRFVYLPEENVATGGMGEYAAALLHSRHSDITVLCRSVPAEPRAQSGRRELLAACGLGAEQMTADIRTAAVSFPESSANRSPARASDAFRTPATASGSTLPPTPAGRARVS